MFSPLFELNRPSASLRGFSDVARLLDEVSHLFRDGGNAGPEVNVSSNERGAMIQVAVPGYSREQLHIDIDRDTVVIRGEAQDSATGEHDHVLKQEIHRGAFERRLQLPFSVDSEHTQARHDNGILTIAVAKPASEQPRRIPISA